ncbi:uncharacterized protein [Pleurodeles waltl]|uniref:uncharacterized protein n=1 Tax=Pleurodeles waltl TaxID=8319 RepID=UPI003709C061
MLQLYEVSKPAGFSDKKRGFPKASMKVHHNMCQLQTQMKAIGSKDDAHEYKHIPAEDKQSRGSKVEPSPFRETRALDVGLLPTPTPAGFVQEGPGTRVTVLAASIVVAVVVLAAVVAGLVFAYNKKWYSGCAAKKADTAAEKISDGKFMGSNQAKVGGPISCLNSPFAIHHSENSYVIQGDGSPGMPHIYEKVTLPCQHVGPVNGANEQRQEKSGIYEMMVQNNHSSNPSSRNNEDSTYQALTLDTLTENTYDTLSQIKLKM